MNIYWTSKLPINGLRHFILVQEINERYIDYVVLVSVLDEEISVRIPKKNFINSEEWHSGWIDLPKSKAITIKYSQFKSKKNKNSIDKIFLEENSKFNIS